MTDRRSSPPAICLVPSTYPPEYGGVATSAQRLARYLRDADYRVHVVTPVERGGEVGSVDRRDEDGLVVHRIAVDPLATGDLTGFSLRRYLKALDAEVGFAIFHGFFLTVAYPCVLAANGPGRPARPTILSIRGNDTISLMDNPGLRSMFLHALERATWVTSVNRTYLEHLGPDVDLSGRSSVIYNGFAPIEAPATWEPGGARRGVVGTVGEFRTVKDIPLLIRAYAALPTGLRRGLVLAGYFSSREEEIWSKMLIGEFGLAEEVEITGPFPRRDLAGHLGRMSVYVQSSAYEGLPNALLEAASVGVPLVATAVGGMAEILEDGESALLVPHGDPAAMTAAIRRVLEDPALARRLSRGATRLSQSLNPEKEKKAWLDLYGRILAGGRKSSLARASGT